MRRKVLIVVLCLFLTAAVIAAFQPKTVRTATLTMTGVEETTSTSRNVYPKVVQTAKLTMTGVESTTSTTAFRPRTVTTQTLTMTGVE